MVFQFGFMVFHGIWLVSMVFQGGSMIFHGFWLPLVVDKDARLSGYADTADRAGSNSLSIGIVLVLTSIVCSSGL